MWAGGLVGRCDRAQGMSLRLFQLPPSLPQNYYHVFILPAASFLINFIWSTIFEWSAVIVFDFDIIFPLDMILVGAKLQSLS